MQAIVTRNVNSPHLFAQTGDGNFWAIAPSEASRLTCGQTVEIKIIDPADQFCRLIVPIPPIEIFVAIDQSKLQLRCYTGNQTIPEVTSVATNLLAEANQLAKAFDWPKPREPYISSTRLGVTVMCEVPYPQRQLTDAMYHQIISYQKQHKWKVSRQ